VKLHGAYLKLLLFDQNKKIKAHIMVEPNDLKIFETESKIKCNRLVQRSTAMTYED
jgi:hypothetical protein